MSFYKRKAALSGSTVDVVEVDGGAPGSVERFCARCSHGVPLHVCHKMLERWETDPDAIYVMPHFEGVDDRGERGGSVDGGGGGGG